MIYTEASGQHPAKDTVPFVYKKPVESSTGLLYNRLCMDKFMLEALKEAEVARDMGEIPVGAIIEKDGEIIGRGHNSTDTDHDTTAHAEMNAIRMASKYLGDTLGWRRLTGCNMYVTMEPCSMCAGALVWARVEKLYIGTMDPKAGACGSVYNIVQDDRLNHRLEVIPWEDGPVKERCGEIVRDFFRVLREKKKQSKEKSEEVIK